MVSTQPGQLEEDLQESAIQEPAKVLLFNDDLHTFEEVISQLMKALRCSSQKAEALTWEVHSRGKAVVYSGEIARCMEVSAILQEIELFTQIEV
jgi:ATP-dependent Clp protease adaptor protein ClpS